MGLLGGRGYWLVVAGLLGVLAAVAGFVALTVLPEVQRGGYQPATASPTAAASPASTATPDLLMGGAEIPAGAACAGCHLTDRGVIGLRTIPAMAHPLDGWRQCTGCHATNSLVKTAPGHSGIHATQCLTCHTPASLPAPLSRPHRDLQNTACLSCHGSTAPLPADMAHRSESVCWLCHRLPDVPPPIPAHQTARGETDCLTCHVGGKVGALPSDHTARTTAECLLCHDVPLGSPAPATTSSATTSSATASSVTAPPPRIAVGWPS